MKAAECGKRNWKKSSFCESNGCIEVAVTGQEIELRDSAKPEGPILRVSKADWEVFIAGAKAGEFDLA